VKLVRRLGRAMLMGGYYLLIVVAIDFVVTRMGLFPLRGSTPGHEVVGFTKPAVVYEDADAGPPDIRVAIIGDSHTFHHKWISRETHHARYLQKGLTDAGLRPRIVSLGVPRFSPVQEMLALDELIDKKHPVDAAIFLFYSGNDFAELLRNDDRPRVEFDEGGRAYVASPTWRFNRPDSRYDEWPGASRLLFLTNLVANVVQPGNVPMKMVVAAEATDALRPSFAERVRYFWTAIETTDDRLGYPGAIAAEWLNQVAVAEMFGERFTDAVEPRVRYFWQEMKRRHAGRALYFFVIPSATLVGAVPEKVAPVYADLLQRIGVSDERARSVERSLIDMLSKEAAANGFTVVDLSPRFEQAVAANPTALFYDEPTLHIDVLSRRIVGDAMTEAILVRRNGASPLASAAANH
jgi:hypothetical protein